MSRISEAKIAMFLHEKIMEVNKQMESDAFFSRLALVLLIKCSTAMPVSQRGGCEESQASGIR